MKIKQAGCSIEKSVTKPTKHTCERARYNLIKVTVCMLSLRLSMVIVIIIMFWHHNRNRDRQCVHYLVRLLLLFKQKVKLRRQT